MDAKFNVSHPYYPRESKLPHYIPNDKGLNELLGVFFGIVGVFLVVTWIYASSRRNPTFSLCQRLILCWFVMCGLIHTVLEGYFSIYHETLAGDMTYLAQLWKEYGKGDSRYIFSDNFTVCMESITAAVDGPLSFLTVALFFRNSPFRYQTQLLVSTCQLYGDSLYFFTAYRDNFAHGPMGHPLYFWFYFVFMNMLWIVIPFCLICQSIVQLARAQALADDKNVLQSKKKR